MTNDPALSELDGLSVPAEAGLEMDQDAFGRLYELTARGVWAYLLRRTGDEQVAEDLLQETYYRFLRTRRDYEGDDHRRHYLFRIASNLANDAMRRQRVRPEAGIDPSTLGSKIDEAATARKRTDLARAMARLNSRQRDALWLAYAEGSSHEEIAKILGLRKESVKSLLFRARKKVAALLDRGGGR